MLFKHTSLNLLSLGKKKKKKGYSLATAKTSLQPLSLILSSTIPFQYVSCADTSKSCGNVPPGTKML